MVQTHTRGIRMLMFVLRHMMPHEIKDLENVQQVKLYQDAQVVIDKLEANPDMNVSEAVKREGISRSAFYKYRDAVHPLYENSRGKTVTVSMNLDHTPGLLSSVLNSVAGEGANILTINQTIPINGIANVTLCIETNEMQGEFSRLINKIEGLQGVQSLRIIARE